MTDDTLQPDPEYVVDTLLEENKRINDNRIYLLSLLKQLQDEFKQAEAVWQAEKESLLAKE